MLRLTVGRRLALIVFGAILALTAISWIALRDAYADTDSAALDELRAIAMPLARAIETDLDHAIASLESEARTATNAGIVNAISRLTARGFVAVQVVDPTSDERPIEVTTNFLQRASGAPAVGSTRVLDGRVGLVMGAPIVSGDLAGDVLVGVYDVDGLVELVGTADGDAEALLAVRNADDRIVIFTPSRYNADRPIGLVDSVTEDVIEEAISAGGVTTLDDAEINGRSSVATLTTIEAARWVLLTSTPTVDPGLLGVPWWLVPLFAGVGVAFLWPVFVLRRRVKDVVRAAQQLSRGQLTQQIADDADDEIGLLARTLQTLDDRLQTDSEQRGRSAAMLQHRASHDPLTGLANRSNLMEVLAAALRTREPVAVLFCDIDDFKGINDSQGHEGGDVVLKHVANQLGTVCGPRETLGRFGGDEFCILSRAEPAEARSLARKVEQALDTSCLVNDVQQKIAGSVGIAIARVTDTADSVLKNADLAMYREKERRRGLRRARRAEEELELISPEQIRLVYQPVVELIEERIVGVEVLARYLHPELGQLDPSSFLPPGTERGMFDTFDLEILTRSIEQLSKWLEHGVVDERFTMSLNLAPDHVSDTVSARQIFEMIRSRRVPASMLQIEVTEHKLHAHEDDLIRSLTTLREGGIKVAIDDFGIEGSNVDRLVQIPSDVVKIDRSFVSDIDVDERAENRLRAIFEIVTTEGLVAIAEGVERQGQARVLRRLGVPFGQGYLWHAPISALALTPLLGRASRWSRSKPAPQRE